MPFEVIETKEHTDANHGRNYSAKHTVTTTYKHPKGLLFKHEHIDGRDYEDVYQFESVTIGDTLIKYSYDWGNYFIMENIRISIGGKQTSCVEQEYGAVDPLKTSEEQKEEGRDIIKQLAADFDLSPIDFLNQFASTFNMKLELMKLYG